MARAAMSPSGIVAVGAGAALGIVAGLPALGAVGLGAVAWAVRVGVAAGLPPKRDEVDPFTLPEPWRGFVLGAQQARHRFDEVVRTTAEGPLRDRLQEVGGRVGDGVRECWQVARRATAIEGALAHVDAPAARAELAEVRAQHPEPGTDLARTAAALEAQVATADRLTKAVAEARSTLRLLDARLDEAVAHAVELSMGTAGGAGAGAALGGLGDAVDGVVGELEALRAALDETGGGGAGGSTT